jgi:AICAR transformylase/IMP cyclohydrolase PurH
MREQDLIDLGFERFDETMESSGAPQDWCYYSLDLGGITFISNASDEWDEVGISVQIMETDILFIESEPMDSVIKLLESNIR